MIHALCFETHANLIVLPFKEISKLKWAETDLTRIYVCKDSSQRVVPFQSALFIRHYSILQRTFTITTLVTKRSTPDTLYIAHFNSKWFCPRRNPSLQPLKKQYSINLTAHFNSKVHFVTKCIIQCLVILLGYYPICIKWTNATYNKCNPFFYQYLGANIIHCCHICLNQENIK